MRLAIIAADAEKAIAEIDEALPLIRADHHKDLKVNNRIYYSGRNRDSRQLFCSGPGEPVSQYGI